jgi:hypothetical protein
VLVNFGQLRPPEVVFAFHHALSTAFSMRVHYL